MSIESIRKPKKTFNRLTTAKRKNQLSRTIKSVCMLIFLIAFAYILLYPVLYIFSNALKTKPDLYDPSVQWISKHLDFSSFPGALKAMNFGQSLLNTLNFEMISCLIEVFTCSVFAYGLARFDLKYKNILIFILILTIVVPDVMLLMPKVMHFKKLDLLGILGLFNKLTGIDLRPNVLDTPWAFWLPSIFGVGLKGSLFIFIYMNFFKSLPKELEEAAMIDGAGAFKTFLRIIVPSSGVVFLTVFIFSMVWHWNDYYLALVYTTQNRPLSYMVSNLQQFVESTFGGELCASDARVYTYPMAGCLIFIAPPTAVYLILQHKFIQSVDRVGIVG